jgi:hypothetical protein
LEDPALVEIARRARGAFAQRTPVGVHAPQGKADWYALYSFAPRLNVLNGMLQAVNGLRTYAQYANDATALQLFDRGDRTARAQVGRYDTGAWSLYSRPGGHPGAEANLNYHTLNRDFSRNLCRATDATAYCRAAEHFTSYLKEEPTLEPVRAVPAPATAGRGVKFRFKLSKISTVGIVVRKPGGAPVFSTSATFPYGSRYFRWVPPPAPRERLYEFRFSARDLAGNTGFAEGTVRVKGRGKR